jgi:hypothetical protein
MYELCTYHSSNHYGSTILHFGKQEHGSTCAAPQSRAPISPNAFCSEIWKRRRHSEQPDSREASYGWDERLFMRSEAPVLFPGAVPRCCSTLHHHNDGAPYLPTFFAGRYGRDAVIPSEAEESAFPSVQAENPSVPHIWHVFCARYGNYKRMPRRFPSDRWSTQHSTLGYRDTYESLPVQKYGLELHEAGDQFGVQGDRLKVQVGWVAHSSQVLA